MKAIYQLETEIMQELERQNLQLAPAGIDTFDIADYILQVQALGIDYNINTWIRDTLNNYPEYFKGGIGND